MPKPSLPNRPTTDVDVIGQAWLNSLMDCVAWAMDYPRPDGRTIFGGPSGTISARVTSAGADPQTIMPQTLVIDLWISGWDVPAGSVVGVFTEYIDRGKPTGSYMCSSSLSGTALPAVLLEPTKGKKTAKAAIYGVAGVRVKRVPGRYGYRARKMDTDNQLEQHPDGNFYLLADPGNYPADALIPVVLGGLDRMTIYNGYFKVVDASDGKISITDAGSLTSVSCGRTDLPGHDYVPRTELDKKPGSVYLRATWDGAAYKIDFGYSQVNDPAANILLATISDDGTIKQVWTGGMIEFKLRYLI